MTLALVGAAIGWLIYVNTYQPLGTAGFAQSGPSMRENALVVSDHLGNHTYVLTGKAGTLGTVNYTLANTGSHDIRVLGLAPGSLIGGRLEWAPANKWDSTDQAWTSPAYPNDARPFPATINAHQSFELFVTVRKPSCPAGGVVTTYGVPIRWQALGVHHVTTIGLSSSSDYFPIALCAPAAAMRLATEGRE